MTGRLKVFLYADKKVELVISRNQQLTVYRIIQEILNNAVRHSAATEVEIFLKSENNIVELCVQDNGTGFELKAIKKGAGLKNIEKRVYLLNGTLTILTKPQQGCKFVIKFPVS